MRWPRMQSHATREKQLAAEICALVAHESESPDVGARLASRSGSLTEVDNAIAIRRDNSLEGDLYSTDASRAVGLSVPMGAAARDS